jgi:hypothetical protein
MLRRAGENSVHQAGENVDSPGPSSHAEQIGQQRVMKGAVANSLGGEVCIEDLEVMPIVKEKWAKSR